MFRPVILDTIRNYSARDLAKDLLAGLIVGVVALPLAIAFAIASGVSPEKGIYTAVIAGFIISFFGGSKVQIGGPTGAFIIVVYGIVQQYGTDGLVAATLMAGVMLMIMGFAKLGTVIKFIPYPLVVGFTSGIAVIIFSSQLKDLFGFPIEQLPADFMEKWKTYFVAAPGVNWYACSIAAITLMIVIAWPKLTHRIPGSLIAILVCSVIVHVLDLPVETIGSRFPAIPSSLPAPVFPGIDLASVKKLVQPAFTIALLGGIESLLSAMVADGMTGDRHRSNTELVAQGLANVFSATFGGIPATGAIARTATNVKNGGRTPVAGMVHALTLLLIILFAGQWAAMVPMATLAGILVMVAYNMSEWRNFRAITKGSGSDLAVLLTSFILTIMVDLTVAIEIGFLLAVFLFMRKLIQSTSVKILSIDKEENGNAGILEKDHPKIPDGVEVFEVTGPLFFGAAYKFKDAIRVVGKPPRFLVIRMGNIPVIDATGINAIKEVHKEISKQGVKLILSEVTHEQVLNELKRSRLLFAIGKANVTKSFEAALKRCIILKEGSLT
ncbi:SulP family inorganic anion transporter [Pseudoflavitalea rhizosphaerae]|uniref:SulP family inorganic anion transporter n=1 Tax=Pseudoflavitalea rhizosphaerae TaxID=1884793 RepID=UPI000F8CD17C|nr:SulP family inorganic anion transporter [Pseudoflavitalea rhizosphaerae]